MNAIQGGNAAAKPKKRIENRYNVWIYRLVLCLSFFIGQYFSSGLEVNMIIEQINYIFAQHAGPLPYAFEYILRFGFAIVQVIVMEIGTRIFFFFANTFSLGAITMSVKNFVGTARVFFILQNIIFAVLSFVLYFFNFFIPFGLIVARFIITTTVLMLFFLYINKHYLDAKLAHRAFKIMAMIYLVYSIYSIVAGAI